VIPKGDITIEAVILDWGGVLVEDPADGLMRYCAKALGVTQGQYAQVHSAMAGPFQEGHVTEQVFWKGVCGRLDRPVPSGSLWGEAFRAIYRPRPEMFDLVTRLRSNGYRTALLSNTEPPCIRYFEELGYDHFDVPVFSCVEGVSKPHRRIYELTLKRLGVSGPQAVFIDDRPVFVKGARKAGLHALLFKGIRPLCSDLAALGIPL
jgi:putative hydrolase of the HAD superfamily